jgi:hypothetical protein
VKWDKYCTVLAENQDNLSAKCEVKPLKYEKIGEKTYTYRLTY